MKEAQLNALIKTMKAQEEVNRGLVEYWLQYSAPNTVNFWINVFMLITPLVVLYFKIDRSRAFHLGFFGFNVHIWSAYFDAVGTRFGYWFYPHQAIPLLPINFGLDTSLIPVSFILLYQWTLNHKKNFYLYALGMCAGFAFVFKPYLSVFHLIYLSKGMNYFLLFLIYVVILVISILITKLFLYFEKTAKK
jgi:hypothetical protein